MGTESNDEWMEAFRQEAAGDSSLLVSLIIDSAPLQAQERLTGTLRKLLPKRTTPTAKTANLADAVVYFEMREEAASSWNLLLQETRSKFGIKNEEVLKTALERNRTDVNAVLRDRRWRRPSR
jgi:hypothetical protein